MATLGQLRNRNSTLRLALSNSRIKFGGGVFIALLALAIFAPLISPYNPNTQNLFAGLLPPGAVFKGQHHLLGTDVFGRDVLSRLLWGARLALTIGVTTVVLSMLIGITVGLISGYFGGWLDEIVMKIVDVVLAFPLIVLAIAIIAIVGESVEHLILILSIVLWTGAARVVRAETLKARELDYVAALKVVGAGKIRIMFSEILPNLLAPILVLATSQLAIVILLEAALSFLGLGVPTSIPSWGEMLNEGRTYIYQAWWLSIFPGVAIFITVLAANVLGDGLRDTLDPKLRI